MLRLEQRPHEKVSVGRCTTNEAVGQFRRATGRTEPGAQLWIDSEKVDVYDDGTFYAVIRLRKEGNNDVQLVAQDAAGNEARLVKRAYVEQY